MKSFVIILVILLLIPMFYFMGIKGLNFQESINEIKKLFEGGK